MSDGWGLLKIMTIGTLDQDGLAPTPYISLKNCVSESSGGNYMAKRVEYNQ